MVLHTVVSKSGCRDAADAEDGVESEEVPLCPPSFAGIWESLLLESALYASLVIFVTYFGKLRTNECDKVSLAILRGLGCATLEEHLGQQEG